MKTKEEIINILKIMFPGKFPYIYEYVASVIQANDPIESSCKDEPPQYNINYTNPYTNTTDQSISNNPNTSISGKGLNAPISYFDEEVFLSEAATGVNNICYELFVKYISVDKVSFLLAGMPVKVKKEQLLREAVDVLQPIVEEHYPNNLWMCLIRCNLQLLDKQRSEEETCLK